VKVGDMHHAIVALDELDGHATPTEVALKLGWVDEDRRPDAGRAETALLAAHEHGYAGAPQA
jgi:hypothetical protein